jgi:F-type H+-transporting ATPase subunit c
MRVRRWQNTKVNGFPKKEMGSVNRILKMLLLVIVVMLVVVTPAFAAGDPDSSATPTGKSYIEFSSYFGVGLTVFGAAYGISKLAASAYDGMSRQPEVAGNIQTAMIIAAALIEGFTFYALFICMMY